MAELANSKNQIVTLLNRPHEGNDTFLSEYREAETIGRSDGDCSDAYHQCPISVFNFIPDVYTKDDQVGQWSTY